MNNSKPYALVFVVAVLAGTIYFINLNSVKRTGSNEGVKIVPRITSEDEQIKKDVMPGKFFSAQEKSKRYEVAKEITTPDGFVNTDDKPITISSLIGKKVILVDFWTYSCINCQRTTPYLNSWYEKYKDKGLVIIGMHTPEFEFEKDYNNVKAAVEKFGIKFPVVLDNDFSTWTGYKNRSWPHKYLIDIDGYIIYDHIGEGAYEETEQKIQEALAERMAVLGEAGTVDLPVTKEVVVESGSRSPETYFGSARNQFFSNGLSGVSGNQDNLVIPTRLKIHSLYLSGGWNISDEFSENSSINAAIVYKYVGKSVFFVSQADKEAIVEVLLDEKPLGAEAGEDIIKTPDGKTVMKIKEARLYKIIQGNNSETHTLKLIIQKPGLKAFTFTFE